MFNTTQGYSLSDIAAVTGANSRSNNNDGWGGDGAWWIILLFLFAMNGRWGWGGGFGGGNSGSEFSGILTRADLCQDMNFADLENGVRGIQQGLCDGFYSQNTTMLQGFNGINNAISNSTADLQSTLCQGFNGVNTGMLQGFNGIQAQLCNDALVAQQCCCDTQNLISNKFCELNYNLATQECDTRRAIADSSRDIIDATNCGTRQILDFLVQDKISALQSENQALKFAASQANQNVALGAMMDANTAEILRRTAPLPVPAYPVCNPYGGYHGYGFGWGGNNFGFGNNCNSCCNSCCC